MRLFGDGFDHYGSNETNMEDGPYAQSDGVDLTTAQFATGTHSVIVNSADSSTAVVGLRKVLPESTDKLGVTMRVYFPQLPQVQDGHIIVDFLSASALRSQLTCAVGANGEIRFRVGNYYGFNGGTGTLVATTDPILTANAWHHVEIQAYMHASAGWIRVAVNGIEVFEATSLDTLYDTSGIWSIAQHNGYYFTTSSTYQVDWYMDDYIIYDFEGDPEVDTDFCCAVDGEGIATEFIGELQGMWLPPNGNTTEDDWLKSTGSSAFALVDEVDPDDADYIYSTAAGDLVELDLTDLPTDITYIRGVDYWGRMSKADSGAALIQFGAKSSSSVTDADERPVTVAATYWYDQINTDPSTGAATATLTFTNQPADTETVTIGAKVYTFQTVLTDVDGNVFIGANLAATIANLTDAINLGAGAGTDYATSTTLNTQVTGVAGATTLVITAKVAGTGGNAIATTETVTNASWGGATMSGGDAGTRWTRTGLNASKYRLTRSV